MSAATDRLADAIDRARAEHGHVLDRYSQPVTELLSDPAGRAWLRRELDRRAEGEAVARLVERTSPPTHYREGVAW